MKSISHGTAGANAKLRGKLSHTLSCGCCAMQNFKWRERWKEAAAQIEDPLDGYVLYRCQSCGWLTRDDMESRWCSECDEWARWTPVIHRPQF